MNIKSKAIAKFLKPGDVINFEVRKIKQDGFFNKLLFNIAVGVIKLTQKVLFGRNAEWKDSHTMLYIGGGKVFSVEPPKPKIVSIDDFSHQNVSIWRYTKRTITSDDMKIMKKTMKKIMTPSPSGKKPSYDEGQLIDILVETIAGYPYRNKIKWFEEGSRRVVCSVGVACVYHNWLHHVNKTAKKKLPMPFTELNPRYWSDRFVKRFEKHGGYWDVQRIFPAHFANSETHFDGEFDFIARIENGTVTERSV